MGRWKRKGLPKIKIGALVEENADSIASAFMQTINLQKFEGLEKKEDNLKVYIKDLINNFDSLSKNQIRRKITRIYNEILYIDKKQDELIFSVNNLSQHIEEINYRSNEELKPYDVEGTYNKKFNKEKVTSARKQLLLLEEVEV